MRLYIKSIGTSNFCYSNNTLVDSNDSTLTILDSTMFNYGTYGHYGPEYSSID